MEEKILIEGKKNKGLIKFLTIAPCVLLIVCLWSFVDLYKDTAEWLIDHYHYAWYSQLEFYSGVASFVLTLVFAIIYFYCSNNCFI